jgi:phosphatidylglycerophosphatase A
MENRNKIKKFCFRFSTFGVFGSWWLSGVIASLFAIPSLLLLRSVYWISFTFFYWLIILASVLLLVIIQGALQFDPERAKRAVVLDKIVGVMIAFVGINLRWRVIIFGFILFHILNTLKPVLFYRKLVNFIEKFPGVLGILGAEILSGFLVNLTLHLVAWVMG